MFPRLAELKQVRRLCRGASSSLGKLADYRSACMRMRNERSFIFVANNAECRDPGITVA
jgi:hypothetical protein